MNLDEADLRELAVAIARRDRSRDVVGWEEALSRAQRRGSLDRMLRALARDHPSDEVLQSIANLVGARRRPTAGMVAALGTAVATAAAALAVVTMTGEGAVEVAIAHPAQQLPATPAPEPVSLASTAPTFAVVPPTAEAEPPRAAPEPQQPIQSGAPPVASGPCATGADDVIGYWYAGPSSPGQAGDIIEVAHSVNVRADYPDRHNRFDARTTVRCVLPRGATVRLSLDPVHVPGDRWWVPLTPADLHG